MRAPFYGELQIHTGSSIIIKLWYSRQEEPTPVEFYRLCDREWQDPADHERAIDRRTLFCALMNRLSEKHHDVLLRRYVEEMTLEEVGKLYGVSRERVRQLERAAFLRCRYWAGDPARLNKVIIEYRNQQKEKMQ